MKNIDLKLLGKDILKLNLRKLLKLKKELNRRLEIEKNLKN